MISSSAPGKIILFGEHAVVYGRPAVAVPVTQVRATVTVSPASQPGMRVMAADIGLNSDLGGLPTGDPLAAAIQGVLRTLGIFSPPALTIQVSSTIPVAAGLGSGAAVSVALIRALSGYLGQLLPDQAVSALAFEVEKLHHGLPSGIDNAVITFSRPVYFVKDQPIITFRIGLPFTLVIADTGLPAPTKESVGDVHTLWEADPPRWERVFDGIGKIAQQAKENIEKGNWRALGGLMDSNHVLLQELSVSSPELDQLVEAARRAGALGAKLSGGGRGGNMIALVEKENALAVADALSEAGAKGRLVTQVA